MEFEREPGQIIVFSHIPKTAGQTWRHLLRSNLGMRHVDVFYRTKDHPNVYELKDLRKDLRLQPWAQSIAGHGAISAVDFKEYQHRLLWYTMLRDPVKRLLSHYQYRLKLRGRYTEFSEWAASLPYPNYQTRWISGEQDVEKAKELLATRFRAVGLLEEYNSSLLIFRQRLGMPDFNVYYDKPKNTAPSKEHIERVKENWDKYEDLIMEHTALDIELYNFVKETIWPQQIKDYGQAQLESDLVTAFSEEGNRLLLKSRYVTNMAFRNLVYKPFVRIDKGSKLQY